MMPLMLITLLPIEWTRHAGIAEAIAYSVYGLPSEKRTIIAMRPGGWRVVRNTLHFLMKIKYLTKPSRQFAQIWATSYDRPVWQL
jgi:hypothetical protein